MMKFKSLIERLFTVHKCGGCGEILDLEIFERALCDECALRWRVAKTESCPNCSQSAFECACMPKGLSKRGALSLRKLYFYSAKRDKEPQNRLLYHLKKHPNKRMAAFVAKELKPLMCAELSVLDASAENTVIVNIPRGNRSKRVYGFDQAELICRELSDVSGISYASAIRRRRSGKEQKDLSGSKRFRNVVSLFEARDAEAVKGKYVVLFDDVVTTGASMAACVEILKKAGAVGVFCLSMAQVP